MNKLILSISAICMAAFSFSQTDVTLKLHHYYNNDILNYGDYYVDGYGNTIEITRVQYYLTGIDLVHDGATNTSLGDTVILASGNITDYILCNANVTTLEAIDFDLGVDAGRNHLDPNTYDPSYPLAPQSPNMHWGWTAGYKFLVIEGNVDTNDDQVPDAAFQFHVTGDDNYLRNVLQITTTENESGGAMDINVDVNVADWLADVDCSTAGFNHGVFPVNEQLMDNTNDFTVFSADIGLSIDEDGENQSNVWFDYSMPYAPTIFYKFPTAESVDLTITDINGRVILSETGMAKAANYFIEIELATGTYIAMFRSDNGLVRSEKFVVQQ